jgi:hypothetical protein
MKNLIFVLLVFVVGCVSEPPSNDAMIFSGSWHDHFVKDSLPMKIIFTDLNSENFEGVYIIHNYFQISNISFADSVRIKGHALKENIFFIDSLYRYHYYYNGTANNTIAFNADRSQLVYITGGDLDTIILRRE